MSDKPTPTPNPQERVVRVFISSTFRDMHAERDELGKKVFLELGRRCRERRIEFLGVDLRWGIPEERKGEVLPVCLAQIERCRPYFIGLLGERYGWVPKHIDEELIRAWPWLSEQRGRSVTELEIINGVLNDPEMGGLSFFYFRDPEASKKIEAELAKGEGYAPEPEASRQKLAVLKERIQEKMRSAGYPERVKAGYPDAKALGQWVLEDLWKVIDRRFPRKEVPSALEMERMDHEAFAAARRKVYIRKEDYLRRLDGHMDSDGPPLVLIGESGCGKSALIANWAKEYRERHPEVFMVTHFIGGTAESADYVHLLRRVMEEIGERYEPVREGQGEGAIPSDPKKIVEAFPLWLAKAAARGKFILILDALNQLEDRDNAPDLGWLPAYFPPNIRVILSTLPGRSMDALKRRGWSAIKVEGFKGIDERVRFIKEYLEQYSRDLGPNRTRRLAEAPQTENPLYLRALLEELQVFGLHEELDRRVDHYLEARTVDDLYEKILERYEEDYENEKERPGLVRDAMSLLWAGRRGLSEAELLSMLGRDGEPLPSAYWSPLFLAAEKSLVSRSGLLTFFHDYMRTAVQDKYLATEEARKSAHIRIADYFEGRELDDRKVDELPWQLQQAESYERLKNCVTDIVMFLKLRTVAKQYELMGVDFQIILI